MGRRWWTWVLGVSGGMVVHWGLVACVFRRVAQHSSMSGATEWRIENGWWVLMWAIAGMVVLVAALWWGLRRWVDVVGVFSSWLWFAVLAVMVASYFSEMDVNLIWPTGPHSTMHWTVLAACGGLRGEVIHMKPGIGSAPSAIIVTYQCSVRQQLRRYPLDLYLPGLDHRIGWGFGYADFGAVYPPDLWGYSLIVPGWAVCGAMSIPVGLWMWDVRRRARKVRRGFEVAREL